MKSFKMKYKISSVALAAVVLLVVILLNAVISAMGDKMNLKVDLTKERVYEFSQQTKEVIKAINKDVSVYALYPDDASNNYVEYAKEYLAKYSNMNDKIKVTYIDPYTNPTFAKKYEGTGESIGAGSIIMECGDKVKVVTIDQLYRQNQYTGSTSIDMEKKMTMAFSFVTGQSGDSKIYFTEGHNELSCYNMEKALEGEGYTCESVNITINGISEDTDLLVIASPSKDFTGEEINLLDEYMDKGGKALYLSTPGIPPLERLSAYLIEWGITPNNDFIIENDKNHAYAAGANMSYPAPILLEHEINNNIIEGGLVFIAPNAGSFTITDSNVRYAKTTALMETTEKSIGKIDLTTEKETEKDIKGPLNVAALSEMQDMSGGKLAVIGSIYSMEMVDGILEEASYANGDFLLNTVSYMTEKANPFDIRAKVISSSTLTMNETQVIMCYILIQYLIPLIIIVAGLVVWLRRRYL